MYSWWNIHGAPNNEKCFEFNIDFHLLFVDFKQTFDIVNRDQLKTALEGFGFLSKLIRLVQMILLNTNNRVMIGGKESDEFTITIGVRYVGALLFYLVLHNLNEKIKLKDNIKYKSR